MGRRSVRKFLKARTLVYCILFTILLILLLSTTAQATEYREVKAEEILKQIESGEDVNLTDRYIVGELNTSNITLKTVPNPYFRELVNEGYTKEELINYGLSENIRIIERNIIIKNSIFKENLNFSNVLFNGSVKFEGTNFNNYANFNGANFNNYAAFWWANFIGPANFLGARFLGRTAFWGSNFNRDVNFSFASFKNDTGFWLANFNSDVNFSSANFNGRTEFKGANFSTITHFSNMRINSSVYFTGPETSQNIITDNETLHIFVKYYTDEARYEDAENIYFNYRDKRRELANYYERSKWEDNGSLISWGYGVRPRHTVGVSILVMIVFAYIYRPRTTVSVVKSKNKMTPVKVYWKESGIYKLSDAAEKKSILSNWDALYFSINIFTRLGSSDWHARENFRKWVTIEAFLGWLLLALLFATTAAHPRI